MLICPGIHLVVSALNAFWPGALDERQRSDDFLVCEVILIGGHVIWVGFADHLFDAVFGHREQVGSDDARYARFRREAAPACTR